jgi:hypothetical protein
MSAPPRDDAPSGWLVVPSHESLYRLYPRNATIPGPPWEPTPPSNFGKDKMITLLVGTDEHELLVHEDYLARHSALFKAALKKEWAEGQTRTIKLPEETPDLVAFYLDYLYGKGLPTDSTKNNSRNGRVYDVLAELYALGERLQDDNIRNVIIDEIVRFSKLFSKESGRHFPLDLAINTIYESTTVGLPSRRLLVELFVTNGEGKWVREISQPEFLCDLATAAVSELHSSGLPCRFRIVLGKEYHV